MTAPRADTVRWRGDAGTAHGMHLEDLAVDSSEYCMWSGLLVSLELCRAVCVLLLSVRGGWILLTLVRTTSFLDRTQEGKKSPLISEPRVFPGPCSPWLAAFWWLRHPPGRRRWSLSLLPRMARRSTKHRKDLKDPTLRTTLMLATGTHTER